MAEPLDFGSELCRRLLHERGPFDLVLNFAAIKHVRSEKDVCSVLQMLDTNVVKVSRLLQWLGEMQRDFAFFSVSTDKAANPVNVMGASKRAMEQVMFSASGRPGGRGRVTSARFANVAFSDGSLLFGWTHRFAKRQPIACPEGARRYFISSEEAGHICLLASTVAHDGQVVVPDLDPERDLIELAVVARRFIDHLGFRPKEYRSEDEARASVTRDMARGEYPLLLTALDTDGEKPFEEFVSEGELEVSIGLPHLKAVVPPRVDEGPLRSLVESIVTALSDARTPITKEEIIAAIGDVLPEFQHAQTGLSLDDRF